MRSLVLVAALAAAAIPLPAQQLRAIRYEFDMEGGGSRGDGPARGTVIVAGDVSRIELRDGDGDGDERNYMLLRDGWLYTVHPERREYSRTRADDFAGIVGTAMRSVFPVMEVDLSDVEIVATDLGAGGLVAGHQTRHLRVVQRFTVDVSVLGMGAGRDAEQRLEVVTDYWVARELKLPANPFVDLVAGAATALAQQDEEFARRSAAVRDSLFSGMPLRLVVNTRSRGRGDDDAVEVEITRVEHDVAVARSLLEVPKDYRQTDGSRPRRRLHSM